MIESFTGKMEKRSGSKFRQTTTGAQLRRKQEAATQDRANQRFFSQETLIITRRGKEATFSGGPGQLNGTIRVLT
jgi:hypothetical protein